MNFKEGIMSEHMIFDINIIPNSDKDMANGMRNTSHTPLTAKEIELVKSEIRRIEADESAFIFNDEDHISKSTCYNVENDKVYVTKNVLPDEKYGSTHPRDLLSIGAVLAHEYYGHRYYREEYLSDLEREDGKTTTPYWQIECRASITAAKLTPNLTEKDICLLVLDAVYRAKEAGTIIEMDDFMKEALYGYSSEEKNITREITRINYVDEASYERTISKQNN